ncbi:MAG: hypothetical protein ABIR30_08365 [Chitinophagaceae bacterium]
MKKLLWLLPLATILCACPFESTVPLSPVPQEAVDSSLVGYWYGIVKDGSDFFGIEALDITQRSDSVYSITRYGKAVKGDIILPDTAYFTGYISRIGEMRFMNIEGTVTMRDTKSKKSPKMITSKVYYASVIDRSHDTLEVKTITENFSVKKFFNRPEDFQQAVSNQLNQQKNVFDDQYSLKYRKIPRPPAGKSF